jgi:transcriptional regulator with PAS, ATPase and Fis domain
MDSVADKINVKNVRRIMNRSFHLLSPRDSLKTAVEYFRQDKIDVLPVIGEDEKLIAAFPKAQLYRALLEGAPPDSPCENYMVADPIFIYEDGECNISQLAQRVTDSPDASVIVLNRDGRAAGIIGTAECLRELLRGGNYNGILDNRGAAPGINPELARMADELEIVKKMQTTIEAVINSSNDGVFVSDTNGNVQYVNDKARILLNARLEDIIGNPIQKLLNTKSPNKSSAQGTPVVDALNIGGKQCIVTHTPFRSRAAGGSSGIVSTIYLNDSAYAEELARRWFDMNQKMGYYRSALEKTAEPGSKFEQIVTTNPDFVKIKRDAQRIARSSSTVLLTGESGVGKSLFARGIHEESPRAKRPFIVVNCVSIPESLFESELFGYAPGSFTGALKTGKPGYFERADKGTIFLDEVGDIPLSIQVKLLQVLQDKEFERVGGTRKQSVDVRIIAATNRDLREAIAQKFFREDLYYRLNVISFHLPPLRERRQDIVPLAATFIGKYNRLIGSRITGIKDSARKVLREYDWPGNIRELENAIEHAANYVWEGEIDVENLPEHISRALRPGAEENSAPLFTGASYAQPGFAYTDEISFKEAKAEFEKNQLLDVLRQTGGNKSAAAKLLNLSRSAFYDRMGKYGVR